METPKFDKKESEIIFSKIIKAGKRVYFFDVKRNRKDELYLTITESKKKFLDNEEDSKVVFEKHQLFLHKEDFDNFANGLVETVDFIKKNNFTYTPELSQKQEKKEEVKAEAADDMCF